MTSEKMNDYVNVYLIQISKLPKARGSSRIITTLSNFFLVPFENMNIKVWHVSARSTFGRNLNGWQFGLANGLFLPTWAERWACVSAVLLEGHFKMSLGRPDSCTQGRVLGRVA
ncbi:Methylcrotonoyl-CoA carboxylase subunit alpha, mitochondrial [Gossypium arboreum]|uniref:Methylcrotonoyl-CoA carboxylase subunit alpha, mitochondrial n=1 Tax=Gossypium arboreum TaxID=29729 RepID=A0A0B0NDL1_GOSAR|nr:Methylcrotonoyl-CoA carboxylase subunit alpha, mitochondrial [Gossypium arboreum]KHG20970.1 Methylcrotonoyl-CoA carboxylase subunit alpha, mitochondrial [Gossypium arboreum]